MTGPSCAISGECPISDGVVIPSSGIICSKRLLLAKIHENGGYDPFSKSGNDLLEESDLISLKNDNNSSTSSMINIPPPKIPSYNSIPSILLELQRSHDAVLLELFDTRQALNETRRELSDALYQNDAAVRVVARISAERDAAREELGVISSTTIAAVAAAAAGKRRRTEDDGTVDEDVDVGPSPPVAATPPSPSNDAMDVDDTTTTATTTTEEDNTNKLLSIQHIEEMTNKWSDLSSARRASKKKNKKKKKGGSDTTADAADTGAADTDATTTDKVIDEELTMETINQKWKSSQNPFVN